MVNVRWRCNTGRVLSSWQSAARPVEPQTAVQRARFCRVFAPDGIFKMPTAALLHENRACWSHFVPSNGRGRTGFYRVRQPFLTIIHLFPRRKPKGIHYDEQIPLVNGKQYYVNKLFNYLYRKFVLPEQFRMSAQSYQFDKIFCLVKPNQQSVIFYMAFHMATVFSD